MIKKTTRRVLTGIGMAALVGAFSASDASAQTTDTFQVLASVAENCVIQTPNDLNFGAYDPGGANLLADLDGSADIQVRCTRGTDPVEILLDLGANTAGGLRNMVGASLAETLQYELYLDAGRTTVWGDTAGNGFDYSNPPTSGFTSVTVFGQVPAGQDVSVDNYEDTVTATVNF
jgi:spore coat protein U-like protein